MTKILVRLLNCVFMSFILLMSNIILYAQNGDSSLLTLERIIESRELVPEEFGPASWMEDGSGYIVLEKPSSGKGQEIVLYHTKSGQREVIVPDWRLIPSGESNPLTIREYSLSPNRAKLLIFTNINRGGRRDLQGDYWVLDLMTWELRCLGKGLDSATLMAAQFSPGGEKVCYVSQHNLYVENLFEYKKKALTEDGTEDIINGTSTILYSGLNTQGMRWSPDGKWIAYTQFNTEGMKNFYLINNTDSLYPKMIPIQHVKPGGRLPACRVGVVSTSGGDTTWMDIPGDPRNNYIYQMDWAENSDELFIQQVNRLQNTVRIFLADARTGEVRLILKERDEAWMDLNHLQWINNGESFIWLSERDGWRHIYKISRLGEKVTLLTPGKFDVLSMEGINELENLLYYIASPENPGQRYLYRVTLDNRSLTELVSPEEQKGTHSYQFSPGSKWAFHTYSTINTPPKVDLIELPEHKTVRVLVDNASLCQKLNNLQYNQTEFFRINVNNGVILDGWSMKPPDFDPNKKYPVLFYVYGMPAGQTVLDRWRGRRHLWHIFLTQKGYIVMSVDNRGTPAPRGRAWRKIIYKKHGILPSDDQAAAVKAISKRWSYIDISRIGIYGWSGGGLQSLLAIFRYPDLYNTAMAGAYLSNHRFYHASFTERYLGIPQDNPSAYKLTAAMNYAENLKGNLLLMHGTGDDNVHYQNTEALINELIAAKKMFLVVPYPNRSHGMREGRNTQYHRYATYTWFLEKNMPPGPR